MSDPKLAEEFAAWAMFSAKKFPPLSDVVRWLNEHGYRVVKLRDAKPGWRAENFEIAEEL